MKRFKLGVYDPLDSRVRVRLIHSRTYNDTARDRESMRLTIGQFNKRTSTDKPNVMTCLGVFPVDDEGRLLPVRRSKVEGRTYTVGQPNCKS